MILTSPYPPPDEIVNAAPYVLMAVGLAVLFVVLLIYSLCRAAGEEDERMGWK